MDTHFATPQRTPPDELAEEIRMVSANPVVSGLLHSVSGLMAILNEHRQVVALNDSFLRMLGIDRPEEVLGCRLGEALHCIHAGDEPSGCGTTTFCSTCGAAMAIVASLGQELPVERLCALSAQRNGKEVDLALLVKSQPIQVGRRRLLLILLQDITVEQQRAALERVFFHDISNMLAGLIQTSTILAMQSPSELTEMVYDAAIRLYREVAIQHSLSVSGGGSYRPNWHECKVEQIVAELERFFSTHPAAFGKRVEFTSEVSGLVVTTDVSALYRVLCNMIINALEATSDGGVVKTRVDRKNGHLGFHVWNQGVIPADVARRVFQRNFSTKAHAGRGIGTYSMKLLGEGALGGRVTFVSSAEQGTVFRFLHPIRQPPQEKPLDADD